MRKTNLFAAAISAVLMASAFTGCGRQASQQQNAERTEEAADSGQQDDSAGTQGTDDAKEINETAAQEEKSDDQASVKVENNGGYFVQLDDQVYFRRYGKDTLVDTALWGEFIAQPNTETDSDEVQSDIVYYDLKDGSVKKAFSDTGYGRLYYGNNGFYLQQSGKEDDTVLWVSTDGSEQKEIGSGTILGISEDGRNLAVEDYAAIENDGIQQVLYLYRDGELAGQAEAGENSIFYAGLAENSVFYLMHNYESGEETLWQLNDAGEIFSLGTLPPLEDIPRLNVVEQMVSDGKNVYIMEAFYEGTAMMLSDYRVIRAAVGEAESVEIVNPGKEEALLTSEQEEAEELLPKLKLMEDGTVQLTAHLPGELSAESYVGGDLLYYDGTQMQTVQEAFAPQKEDGRGIQKIAQSLEYIDGAVYAIVASVHVSPLDDVGWREAYRLLNLSYLRIPLSGEKQEELAFVDTETVLSGNVWFVGEPVSVPSQLLWQQTRYGDEDMMDEYSQTESNYAILEDISPDAEYAYYDDSMEVQTKPFDAAAEDLNQNDSYYVPYLGEADYYGYPLPDQWEDGSAFRILFRLDRDGRIIWMMEDIAG